MNFTEFDRFLDKPGYAGFSSLQCDSGCSFPYKSSRGFSGDLIDVFSHTPKDEQWEKMTRIFLLLVEILRSQKLRDWTLILL